MALTFHFYLDARSVGTGQPAPVKLVVTKHGRAAMLPSGVSCLPSDWDARSQTIRGARGKVLTGHLRRFMVAVEDYIQPQLWAGDLADLSAAEIRDRLDEHFYGSRRPSVTAGTIWAAFVKGKQGNSRAIYESSYKRICAFDPTFPDADAGKMKRDFAARLASWMEGQHYKTTTRNTTLRSLAAVWSAALKAGSVKVNPFAGMKAESYAPTARDLSAEQLRTLWNARTVSEAEAFALDTFKLSFLLRGINCNDLARARCEDIVNGRLAYRRSKTKKAYSVRVEPEAAEIIARYSDGEFLLPQAHTRHRSVIAFIANANACLKRICKRHGLPAVSTYYVRHTVASRLVEQGTPMAVVSRALGHSLPGAQVTSLYVDVQEGQVDAAFRQLLDWLLYDRK